jgi:lysophospholipase L1-like esterase
MRLRAITLALLAVAGIGCQRDGARDPSAVGEEERVRYVALGDSYTIGTSISEGERWPNQLTMRVPELQLVANLAVNGYTSADLIDRELPALDGLGVELVTVLIGVNDVVQGVPDGVYAANVAVILDRLLDLVPPDRIVCVATPDYTRTPRGAEYGDPETQSDAIVRFNAILREACEGRGGSFVPQVFEISLTVTDDPALVANDGLHPSGEQYRRWVEVIEPVMRDLLGA